ncbi:MAG: FHA domain-containing protein [Solirubrobacteraceae bacterium]|jgi:hypothetical protein
MGARDEVAVPDFLAIGLGATGMMSMLWAVAAGRTAVGVEMRGDPFLGVRWNIREDLYHQLGLIDELMLQRYGEQRLPRRGNGKLFRLAECFYSPETSGGGIVTDEIIDGFDSDKHVVGTIENIEFIDDRWRGGRPNRIIALLDPPRLPRHPDPRRVRSSIAEVLDGPSTFQAEAASVQKLLRRYLELIEQQDRKAGFAPRVRLFTHHRVLTEPAAGFIELPDGRKAIQIEVLQEFDFKGRFVRIRKPSTTTINLGVPELFMIAEGANSTDAARLGFEQHDVEVDHHDGRGPVVAQADFVAGLVEVLVGGRLRRRISSAFDHDGHEYWVRQIAVGHENDPQVGWVLVQVPDFETFNPVQAGLVRAGTSSDEPEYFAAFQHLLYNFYIQQAAEVLEIRSDELRQVQMIYGPKLFSLVERVGADPLIAANGIVAGDAFGNGHFLTSGGAMTGMIGHSTRVLEYWQARDAGHPPASAIRRLADSIRSDTHAWLDVSAKEYSQAAPSNFGAERVANIERDSGNETSGRAETAEAARRQRLGLIPLNPSDWRRPFIHNGRVISELPELLSEHPLQRPERAASLAAVLARLPAAPDGEQAEAELTRISQINEQRMTGFMPAITDVGRGAVEQDDRDRTKLSIGRVTRQSAARHGFLFVLEAGGAAQRFTLDKDELIIGRREPQSAIAPDLDLAEYDPQLTVSRRHARIVRKPPGFAIEDLDSTNKTRLGESALPAHHLYLLKDGEKIRFGNVEAVFRMFATKDLSVARSSP